MDRDFATSRDARRQAADIGSLKFTPQFGQKSIVGFSRVIARVLAPNTLLQMGHVVTHMRTVWIVSAISASAAEHTSIPRSGRLENPAAPPTGIMEQKSVNLRVRFCN